ncbi:hypothetical protein M3Y99_00713100 [Aphelenchoides fujianensis]|nr:hypothetical protein M3Y99_00713100 [Aphelenchoides fujianensis]
MSEIRCEDEAGGWFVRWTGADWLAATQRSPDFRLHPHSPLSFYLFFQRVYDDFQVRLKRRADGRRVATVHDDLGDRSDVARVISAGGTWIGQFDGQRWGELFVAEGRVSLNVRISLPPVRPPDLAAFLDRADRERRRPSWLDSSLERHVCTREDRRAADHRERAGRARGRRSFRPPPRIPPCVFEFARENLLHLHRDERWAAFSVEHADLAAELME